ncbi:ABC transporter substrate-binding protein [Pseudomonas sp. GX19020]|uniref:ABC transporter substrate-binding protein n=2 Tax=Pseudomonadota TaxID=1224 RepID=UPI0020192202|nr:ABC transporter substrate-binding protein [Pseudomonas sp. GX19020]MCL4067419.1 ABC transporter substrate-binding protein [Pseudomonas sp. GX19020]
MSIFVKGLRRGIASTALLGLMAGFSPALAESTIVMGVEADFSRMDPAAARTWNTFKVIRHVYETFVEEDLTKGGDAVPEIVPALAESWEISDDRRTYTFHLRKGVKFHDGSEWNADAAKFNLDRMTNPDFEYFVPASPGLMGWVWGDLESYAVVDPYTFTITLTQPNAEFLRRLTAGGSGSPRMVSPTAVATFGNDGIEQNPIGTGPFKFVERVPGERVTIAKNPDYWNPERIPKTDRIILRAMPEVSTRELAIMSGEVDIIGTPSPDSIAMLEAQGLQLITGPSPMIYVMWFNTKDEIFKDVRVRKAACMAINREEMALYQRMGYAQPTWGVLNPGGPGYDPDFRDCDYDPEGAKALLAEAGYPDGLDTRMDWTFGGGADVNTKGDAEWLQRDWAKVGIRAKIEMFDNNAFWDMMSAGMRDGTGITSASWGESTFSWLDQLLPTTVMPPNCCNSGYYDNPEMDRLLSEARAAGSEEEMVAKLQEARDIVAEDMAFSSYFATNSVYVAVPGIKDFRLAPQHWFDLTSIVKE